ncbi:Uncharacterized membrane protein YgdD, TMEM256/DUF423 family [Sphingomonas laterariae]|uniref:Uncharacterized membrane protein YgdD, TMEM256/DUF423 family n=1 Tax=Edaphosphingomonas laterariae TaxID=861865 RepID=A0A239BHY3_9SPHN|nr:DUF423 domain-containing protein [Sphingomonas laterariae]SNS07757.1 Uncharacterized membrane protein YgdD, TMEM256/DUF423 family [Sphingomonas laterariae]
MKRPGMVAVLAALSGALAVTAGAFGAHGATGKAAEWLRTGATYQMVHAAAALAVLAMPRGRGPALLMLLGALVFAGTLYAMALGAPRWLGAVTPLGGLAMIGGWLLLAIIALRR